MVSANELVSERLQCCNFLFLWGQTNWNNCHKKKPPDSKSNNLKLDCFISQWRLLTCTLIALSKSSCFLMRASTLSRESPLSSLAKKASRAAIQFSACSQSRLNSCRRQKETWYNLPSSSVQVLCIKCKNGACWPAAPGTDLASSCAGPRPSPGQHVPVQEPPASVGSQGWHSGHEQAAAVQIVQKPGRCLHVHRSQCGVPTE